MDRRFLFLLKACVLLVTACSFDESPIRCSEAKLCPAGQSCYRGFCVPASDAGKARGAVTTDARVPDAQPADAAIVTGTSPDAALAPNMSEPVPSDCVPAAESCDGKDEDCDGKVDEGTERECYPEGTAGCANGRCQGTCMYGKQRCVGGELQACSGAQTPRPERCTQSGETAVDESCDGKVDEGCSCTGGDTRSCYMGPDKTAGVGRCKAGLSTCRNGQFGACENSVTPAAESCGNEGADDDCNGVKDDVRDRNGACPAPGAQGACMSGTWQCQPGSSQLQCVAAKPAAEQCNGKDDDCNGITDDGFDLQNDPKHCGSCDKACAAGQLCCAGACAMPNDAGTCNAPGTCPKCAAGEECCNGKCIDTHGSDVSHCGSCSTVCGSGAKPGCCAGQCVDFTADPTCGRCDNACGLLSLGGLACKCGLLNGAQQCVGVDVGGLLQLCL